VCLRLGTVLIISINLQTLLSLIRCHLHERTEPMLQTVPNLAGHTTWAGHRVVPTVHRRGHRSTA